MISNLVCKADFERVPTVVDILDHLRSLYVGANQRRVNFA